MLKINGLCKSFDGKEIVRSLDMELADGASAVILGPSGSGKTTLLRMIAGLEMPDSGEIFIGGKICNKPGWVLPPSQRGLGFVFQTSSLWPHMTVEQNILFGLQGLPAGEARERAAMLLDKMSLSGMGKRYPHQISGGEARRAAIARSLAPAPGMLLMDEPLTNLNADLKSSLLEIIKAYASDNHSSLVYVTHDAEEARQIGGITLTMKNGRLEE